MVALGVLVQDVRTRTSGLLGVVIAGVGDHVGVDDVEVGDGVHERSVGLRQVELDREVIDLRAGVDAGLLGVIINGLDEDAAATPAVLLLDGLVVVGHDGVGVELGAVLEGDALVQVEGVGAGVLGDLIGVSGAGHQVVVLVQGIQGVVDVVHDVAGVAVGPVHRVHLLELTLERKNGLILVGRTVGHRGLDDKAVLVGGDGLDSGVAGTGGGAGISARGGVTASGKTQSSGTRGSGANETTTGDGGVQLVFQIHENSPFAPALPPGLAGTLFLMRAAALDGCSQRALNHIVFILTRPSVYDALT